MKKNDENPVKWSQVMIDAGFQLYHTGGGCWSYEKTIGDDYYLITHDDLSVQDDDADKKEYFVGRYHNDHDGFACIDKALTAFEAIEQFKLLEALDQTPADQIVGDDFGDLFMKIAESNRIYADAELSNLLQCANVDNNIVSFDLRTDRETYEKMNSLFESIGGIWIKENNGHVFPYDPAELVNSLAYRGWVTRQEIQKAQTSA